MLLDYYDFPPPPFLLRDPVLVSCVSLSYLMSLRMYAIRCVCLVFISEHYFWLDFGPMVFGDAFDIPKCGCWLSGVFRRVV